MKKRCFIYSINIIIVYSYMNTQVVKKKGGTFDLEKDKVSGMGSNDCCQFLLLLYITFFLFMLYVCTLVFTYFKL